MIFVNACFHKKKHTHWISEQWKEEQKNSLMPSRIDKCIAINRNMFNKKTSLPLPNRILEVSCVAPFELWQIVEMQTAINVISLRESRKHQQQSKMLLIFI